MHSKDLILEEKVLLRMNSHYTVKIQVTFNASCCNFYDLDFKIFFCITDKPISIKFLDIDMECKLVDSFMIIVLISFTLNVLLNDIQAFNNTLMTFQTKITSNKYFEMIHFKVFMYAQYLALSAYRLFHCRCTN